MSCLYSFYCVFYILIHFVTAQFPDHVDFQRVEEINFNNAKYNVLKPTIHKITDHFEDFMRRGNKNKGEIVFLDDNGFRHFWSGFGTKRSLRKTKVSLYDINKQVNENAADVDKVVKDIQNEEKAEDNNRTDLENVSDLVEVDLDGPDNLPNPEREELESLNDDSKPVARAAATPKPAAKPTTKPTVASTTAKTASKPATAAAAAPAKPAAAAPAKPAAASPAAAPAASGGKTVAVTTFFCPFFGIIKMTTFI